MNGPRELRRPRAIERGPVQQEGALLVDDEVPEAARPPVDDVAGETGFGTSRMTGPREAADDVSDRGRRAAAGAERAERRRDRNAEALRHRRDLGLDGALGVGARVAELAELLDQSHRTTRPRAGNSVMSIRPPFSRGRKGTHRRERCGYRSHMTTGIVGRDRLIADAVRLCAETDGLLLVGEPGVGVSTVAAAVVARLGDEPGGRPVTLVDDVALVDSDEALALERAVGAGCRLIAGARTARGPRPAIVGALLRTCRMATITIEPLGWEACLELAERAAGPLAAANGATLARLTLGRPGRVVAIGDAARSGRLATTASPGGRTIGAADIRRLLTAAEGRRRLDTLGPEARRAVAVVLAAGRPIAVSDLIDVLAADALTEAVDAELVVVEPGDDRHELAPDARARRPAVAMAAPWLDACEARRWMPVGLVADGESASTRAVDRAQRCAARAAAVYEEFCAAVDAGDLASSAALAAELDPEAAPLLLDEVPGVRCLAADGRRRWQRGDVAGAGAAWLAVVDRIGDPAAAEVDDRGRELPGALAGLAACAAASGDLDQTTAWAGAYDLASASAPCVHAERMRAIAGAVVGGLDSATDRLYAAAASDGATPWDRVACACERALLGAPLGTDELARLIDRSTPTAGAAIAISTAVSEGDVAALDRAARELAGLEHYGWATAAWAVAAAMSAAAGDETARLCSARQVHSQARLGRPGWALDRSALSLPRCTERELEVAALAAAGFTRRALGSALFISPKTVDRHLGAVFAKLGVTRQAELISALASLGVDVRPGR